MKRFHVHISVENLSDSIHFYSALFNQTPTVEKPDYAKWMMENPRINFAISKRNARPGIDHLGIQVETDDELQEVNLRLAEAQLPVSKQTDTTCCYTKSDKYWTLDPQNVAWEAFHTLEDIPFFGGASQQQRQDTACCAPSNIILSIKPKTEECC
jgi:glyoxalase/bleomycin resistance protein/dioxygenase superfamily protein